MATLNLAAIMGGAGGSVLLPREVSQNIWQKAADLSIVPTLSTSQPMILGENVYPMLTKRPAASMVDEGGIKPQTDIQLGAKTIKPRKAVVATEMTLESVLSNPSNVLGLLETEFSGALARQIDLAILHGKEASTGKDLAGAEFVNQTTNRVELAPDATTYDNSLWGAYQAVTGTGNNFNGFAMDPRLVGALGSARNASTGMRLHPEIGMGNGISSFEGQRCAVSKTVSGQVDASVDTKVRAFCGDWDALRWGRVLDIRMKKIEYGNPLGNGDLQARNCVAFLAEVFFGWGIMDLSAFAAVEDKVA